MAAVPSIGRASRIAGAVAPEADATRALYEAYASQIFRYCLHQLGSREEAEDAVQSTFLNAFRGIKRGIVPELEGAWLFKIAHNVCLSRRRSAWRRGRIESPADFQVVQELAPAPSRGADELIGLQDVLERLPEPQRRAILLREWQGLSYREIAEELELTQAAVETLIFRARRSLAQGLEQPSESPKRRAARMLDWSNVLSGLKAALVGGSAAAKIAASLAVVSASTVVAVAPTQQHIRRAGASLPRVHPAARARHGGATVAASAPAVAAPLRVHQLRAHRRPAARVRHRVAPVAATTSAVATAQAPPVVPAVPAPTPPVAPTAPVPVQPAPAPVSAEPTLTPAPEVPVTPPAPVERLQPLPPQSETPQTVKVVTTVPSGLPAPLRPTPEPIQAVGDRGAEPAP